MWTEVDAWFVQRGHHFAVEGVRPLASLWGSAEELPPNLAVSLAIDGQLALPEQPVFAEEEWRLYPLNFAPPTPMAAANQAGLHKSVHKSVPHWNKGWKIEYHGSSLYGISSAISVGEVFPSPILRLLVLGICNVLNLHLDLAEVVEVKPQSMV